MIQKNWKQGEGYSEIAECKDDADDWLAQVMQVNGTRQRRRSRKMWKLGLICEDAHRWATDEEVKSKGQSANTGLAGKHLLHLYVIASKMYKN